MTTLRTIGLTCFLASGCAHEGAGSGASASTTTPTPGPAAQAAPAAAAIETKELTYDADGTPMKGFLAYPVGAQGPRPGVLVVHEWWGFNDYARMRARKLAEMGYVGFAIDMYGNGKQASHPDDAQKFSTEVASNPEVAMKRFIAAKTLLAGDPRVDPSKIAAIGYCFGGGVVLNMARAGVDLDAVASFHGMLGAQTPMQPGKFAGAILVAAGGADPFVPPEQVQAFKKEMDAAGAKYDVVVYPNTKHGFTNPEATENGKKFNLPLEYSPDADADSWAKLGQLLARVWPS